MLSDRSYMREQYPRQRTSVLTWLICALSAGFILQLIFQRWIGATAGSEFERALELSPQGIRHGYLWTLLTYGLLHNPYSILHIVGNLLGLYFFGREVLPHLGERRFLSVFVSAILVGGLAWLAVNWNQPGSLIGASAGVSALLVVFACLSPNQPITLLLFFILPVTLRPKYLAIGLFVLDALGLVFYELLGARSIFGMAHSAHLGGMAIGWLYYRFVHQREWRSPDRAAQMEIPRWLKQMKKAPPAVSTPPFKINLSNRENLRAEVDRILDKINSQGFGALTTEEKHILDEAKEILSRP